jgi:hypothetical protein
MFAMRNTNKLLAMLFLPMLGCAGSGLGKEVRQDVSTQMTAAEPNLNTCFQAALARNRKVQGTITLGIVAESGTGKFTKVAVQKSDVGDPELERCVIEQISTLKLTKPTKTNLQVEYPVKFTAVD